MRRFRINENREKQNRAMLTLAIVIISVSIAANMNFTGFATQPSNQELLEMAWPHAERFIGESRQMAEISLLDHAALSARPDTHEGVPEGSYEVRFVSGSRSVSVIIYNREVFRIIL